MKNIHTLPTNKPSRLQKNKHNKLFLSEENKSYSDCIIQNIHITNDEEIKEGDYGILGKEVLSYHQMHKKWGMPQGKKIILTTDADLVKDGVQAIPDEFLEWFVNNPSCEEVEVTYGVLKPFQSEDKGYLIHCPDNEVLEEPKQDLEKEMFELEQELDIPSNLRWHNSKPKQETLDKQIIMEVEVRYMTEFGSRITTMDIDKLHIFTTKFKILSVKPIVDFYTKKDMKRAFDVGFQVGYNDETNTSYLTFEKWFDKYKIGKKEI